MLLNTKWKKTVRKNHFTIMEETEKLESVPEILHSQIKYKGGYFRLVDGNSEAEKIAMLRRAINQMQLSA
jgi:hypothetical protein